ncbi:hypothetical protein [Glaciibacter superstes]|uniref:hypothetical protein n=1 Tax=Glaciibacter superstes TaxID=501023 RepID=UPI000A032FBA
MSPPREVLPFAQNLNHWQRSITGGTVDYKDLPEVPKEVASTTAALAANAAHLAGLLKSSQYPPRG